MPRSHAFALARLLLKPRRMSLSIKQLPLDNRPRERLLFAGPSALADQELIALVFGGDLDAAERVVLQLGGAPGLLTATLGELRAIEGVGPARAAQLQAALEIGRRAAGPIDRNLPVRTPEQARELLRDLCHLEHEEMRVLVLDSGRRLLSLFTSASGAANVVHVSPRDIFRRALREGGAGIICAHNHPSGDPVPSPEDVQLTRRLTLAGQLVGLSVIDHLIVSRGRCFSFTDQRLF